MKFSDLIQEMRALVEMGENPAQKMRNLAATMQLRSATPIARQGATPPPTPQARMKPVPPPIPARRPAAPPPIPARKPLPAPAPAAPPPQREYSRSEKMAAMQPHMAHLAKVDPAKALDRASARPKRGVSSSGYFDKPIRREAKEMLGFYRTVMSEGISSALRLRG